MAISKVILNGETQMDVTQDTVTPDVLVEGYTALRNNGVRTTGTFVPAVPATETPLMDGTAAVGTSAKYAREDHVHPSYYAMTAAEATAGTDTTAKTIAASVLKGAIEGKFTYSYNTTNETLTLPFF